MSPIQGLRPEKLRELVLLILIALVLIVFSSVIENYLNARLFNRVSASVALMAVLAIGQTMVVLTRNIDLSVGSIVGFTAYFVGHQLSQYGDMHPLLAIFLAVGVGTLMGNQWDLSSLLPHPLHHCHLGHNGSLPYFVGGIFRRSNRIDRQSPEMAA